jgi:capsular polysaccharide biosynthesis protein
VPIDKDVPVLRINFISHVPQKSADIVNTLAKIYVTDYIDAKVKAANTTVQFLNSQIDTLNRRLTNSQDNIEDYRIKENIINTQQETETDLRKISQLKIQSSNLRMQLDAVSKLYAYLVDSDEKTFLNQAPNFEAFNDLLSTEIVKNIKDLQIKRHDLLLEYTPYDEKVKIIDVKIREYRNYLIESVKNSLDNYKTKYERLTDEIYAAQSSFVGLPEKEKNMNILQRSFTLNEQTYNFLQQKHTEAEIAREAAISFHRIIQYGEVNNEPVTPKKGLLKILAIVLGLAIGMLIVFVLHSLHGRVEDETHIETLSETELLGKIPFITSDENAITVFDELTMELQLKKILQIGTIISINSFEKGDGKSFIARLLSKSLIKSGWDVVVIVPDLIASKPTYVTEDGIKCFVTPATDKICNFINECKIQNPNSVFILKNLQISKSKAGILAMGCCQTNLFLFDTQQSNLRRIEQANLLQDEYKFNNFYFIINRFGHHKNLKDWAVFFTQWIKKYILRIND